MIFRLKPHSRKELKYLIDINTRLYLINTSSITDMSCLFLDYVRKDWESLSMWDTHNVTNMSSMFLNSNLNAGIEGWDVSKVEDMSRLFTDCQKINCSLKMWNTKNVRCMYAMFAFSSFNKKISKWNVKKVENAEQMFFSSSFNQDISKLAKQNPIFKDRYYLGLED